MNKMRIKRKRKKKNNRDRNNKWIDLANTEENVTFLHVLVSCFVLFDFFVPSTNFQLYSDVSSWIGPVLSYNKCVLLKDHNAVTQVRLEPAALLSPVKHSTAEPLVLSGILIGLIAPPPPLMIHVQSIIRKPPRELNNFCVLTTT